MGRESVDVLVEPELGRHLLEPAPPDASELVVTVHPPVVVTVRWSGELSRKARLRILDAAGTPLRFEVRSRAGGFAVVDEHPALRSGSTVFVTDVRARLIVVTAPDGSELTHALVAGVAGQVVLEL